jgi:CDP-diacylglycerol pyrophosphatase
LHHLVAQVKEQKVIVRIVIQQVELASNRHQCMSALREQPSGNHPVFYASFDSIVALLMPTVRIGLNHPRQVL